MIHSDIRLEIDRRTSSRGAWISLLSAWIVGFAALAVWLLQTPTGLLREQLKTFQLWSLETCVALGLVLGCAVVPGLWRGLDRGDALRMATVGALALGLTVFVAPRTNRIYYDEQIYQGVAQNLADLKLAQMCNDGTVEYGRLQCWSGEYNKQPYAYPHMLSLVYRVFGVHATTAFAVNAAAIVATVCLVYLLAFTMFHDRITAVFAGLLIPFVPQQVIWSATAAAEPSASLACVVALLSVAHFLRSRSTIALAAAAVATAYSVQFRPESILIVPVIGLLLWFRSRDEFTRPRLWWLGLLFFALTALHVAHLFAVRNEGWGANQARLSLGYVTANLRVNGWFYLGDERFPIVFTLLAALGLSSRRRVPERMALVAYFLVFFGMDLLFYAGSYNYGADVRYSLMTYPPLAVLGGLGAAHVVRWLNHLRPGLPAQAAVMAGLAFQFLWYVPLVRATTEEAWAARADVRFAKSFVPELPENSYVLTHNPGMFHVWGVNAGQMSLVVANPGYLDYLGSRYAGGVYLHWNFWCNVQDPVQRDFCQKALDLKPIELMREYRERDQRYALYRIQTSLKQD